MRHLLVVILLLMAGLVATVTGCRGTRVPDDARLVAADSLLASAPDSTLALVEALALDSLATDGDRAYRDLLLTQARYKCYISATSDSDINRALGYYRAHSGEQEKLTRAYIYKGAVMEELGHPDSAMLYYKHAEAIAAPDDYFNLGYVKMRIATLYQEQYSQDTVPIILLKDAIRYFTIVNDTNYLISCYGDLGALCGVKRPDSTEYYLINAIRLAQQSNNAAKQYTYESKLAGFNLYYKKDYRKANLLSMDVLRNGSGQSYERQFYYYAALSFIKLGLLDSAKYILGITPAPVDRVDSMNYFNLLSEIEKANNHPSSYASNALKAAEYINDILSDTKEYQLYASEIEFDKRKIEKNSIVLSRYNHTLITALLIVLSLLLFLLFAIFCLRKKQMKQLCDIENYRKELESALTELKQQKKRNSEAVSKHLGYRIAVLNELYHAIRLKRNDNDEKRKIVVPLSSLLKELNENNKLLKINLNETFWNKLRLSVDAEFNGIVSFVERRFPSMRDSDIKLFTLLCARIPPQIINLCMNYTNSKTSSTYRNRIVKKKMGLNMTFDEFIESYMKGDIN